MTDPEFIDVKDAAIMLNVCTRTVRRWIAAGKLDAVRTPGGYVRIVRASLMESLTEY